MVAELTQPALDELLQVPHALHRHPSPDAHPLGPASSHRLFGRRLDTPEVDNQNAHRARNGLFDLGRIIEASLSG